MAFFLPAALRAQSEPALARARQQIASADLAGAEATLRQSLVAAPQDAEADFLLGTVLFRMQRPEASLAAFTAGARFSTPRAEQLVVVASDYILLKDRTHANAETPNPDIVAPPAPGTSTVAPYPHNID